jgi:predicted ATPase
VLSGWALAAEGFHAEGLARLRQGLADWRATGSVTYETYYLGLLAEVLAETREFDEALHVLDTAIALVERSGERFYEPELYRLRSEVLLAGAGELDSTVRTRAEDDLRHSLELARKQSARSLEIRSAMSLFNLDDDSETNNPARDALATLYASFTEGFDTNDLKHAQAMLKLSNSSDRTLLRTEA